MQACTWMSGCSLPTCEDKCVANLHQELNDQYSYSPGALLLYLTGLALNSNTSCSCLRF